MGVTKSLESGFSSHLAKPVNVDELQKLMESLPASGE